MTEISTNYRPLTIADLANVPADAWKHPNIPQRQYELAVKQELANFRHGGHVAPYDALVRCLFRIPPTMNNCETSFLDAGCSSGYYSEVLQIAGFGYQYTGVDFSESFVSFARRLYPEITFECQDAGNLQYPDGYFDIVLSSAVMMHCLDYIKIVSEAVRVSKRYVLLHRTPVFDAQPTTHFVKDAYSVPVIELHFEQGELLTLFDHFGLTLIYETDVFKTDGFAHRSYLLRKDTVAHVTA